MNVLNDLRDGFVHQFGSFAEQDGALYFQSAFIDQFFGNISIRALKANDDRDFNIADALISINNALGYTIATYNTTKDIDEDGFHFWIF